MRRLAYRGFDIRIERGLFGGSRPVISRNGVEVGCRWISRKYVKQSIHAARSYIDEQHATLSAQYLMFARAKASD